MMCYIQIDSKINCVKRCFNSFCIDPRKNRYLSSYPVCLMRVTCVNAWNPHVPMRSGSVCTFLAPWLRQCAHAVTRARVSHGPFPQPVLSNNTKNNGPAQSRVRGVLFDTNRGLLGRCLSTRTSLFFQTNTICHAQQLFHVITIIMS